MPVVAAGVHPAGVPGGIGQPGRLLDRQRVHVRPDADRAAAGAAAKRADDAGAGDAAGDLDPPRRELRGHDAAGPVLLKPEFRMGVQVAAPLRQIIGGVGYAV